MTFAAQGLSDASYIVLQSAIIHIINYNILPVKFID